MEKITPDAYGHYEEIGKVLNFVLTEPSRGRGLRGEEILRIEEGETFSIRDGKEESLTYFVRRILLGERRKPYLLAIPIESKDVGKLTVKELDKKYSKKRGHILNPGPGVLRASRNKNIAFFETLFTIAKKKAS